MVAECTILDCTKPVLARGWCPMHYRRWRKNGDPLIRESGSRRVRPCRVNVDPCSIEGCTRKFKALGLCATHYWRFKKHGTATPRLRGQVVDGRRICPGCDIDKLVSEYTPGSTGRCRSCVARDMRVWRVDHPWVQDTRLRRLKSVIKEKFVNSEIFERDKWVCQICMGPIEREAVFPAPLSPSLDHIVPLSRGGLHERENVQATHLLCNMKKGDREVAA